MIYEVLVEGVYGLLEGEGWCVCLWVVGAGAEGRCV